MAFNDKPEQNKQPSIGGGPNSAPSPKVGQFSAPKSPAQPKTGGGGSSMPKTQPTLNKQKSHELTGSKIQPGSPTLNKPKPGTIMGEPFGVTKGMFESKKKFNKKINDTFKESGQPTLRVSQGNKNQIKFNPAFDKTKEINQSLGKGQGASMEPKADPVREKIMKQGFAPKEYNQNPKPVSKTGPAHDHILGFTGDTNDMAGMQSIVDNQLQKYGRIGGGMYDDLDQAGYYLDAENKVQRKVPQENRGQIPDVAIDEDYERSWGPQGDEEEAPKPKSDIVDYSGYDKDTQRIAKELDEGEPVILNSELLTPSDYGFDDSDDPQYTGYEDLAVEARKTDDGKYDVWLYRENQDGPMPGEYPEDNEPTYTFDTFEELKEFMDNDFHYDRMARKKASNLFGTDLNKKEEPVGEYDPNDEPGSVVVTPKLADFTEKFLLDRGMTPEFAKSVADNLHTDHKMADYYRARMKEANGGK